MKKYLDETKFLDYSNESIQKLIKEKKWRNLDTKSKILNIYNFVRDDISFGFNERDELSASRILKDGFGQCNTKGILFMALLRANGIPCRIHAFHLNKKVQRGIITGLTYKLSPNDILHTWVEIFYKDKWLNIEGFILDTRYFKNLQKKFNDSKGEFFGYGVGTDSFQEPETEWKESNTYIQKEGITEDLGIFATPDELFNKFSQNVGSIKRFFFEKIVMNSMNKNICEIRDL